MGKRGSGSGGQASNAKEMKMFLQHRMWREYWYVLAAAGAIVAALFGSAFLQFSSSQDHVYRLDVVDAPLMERVFHSGEPWVVLCSKPDDIMPEVFDKVAPRLAGKSFVGVLDCSQPLPTSGKTIWARYGIKPSVSPTVFTVANGEKPKQVFLNDLQSSKALAKRVRAATKKSLREVQSSAQLEARCLSRPACVLLLRGQRLQPYEKQWLDTLMQEHRTLSFAWMDASYLKLSLESSLPDVRKGEHRLMLFRRQRDPETGKRSQLSVKAFRGGVFDALSVGMFLDEHMNSDALKPLGKSPTISRKRKKKAPKRKGAEEPEHTKKRPREKRKQEDEQADKQTDAQEDDEYYFPQQMHEEGEAGAILLEDVAEDEEVLDLDDEDFDGE